MTLGITEHNRRWWTLGAMCCALFMSMIDSTVVNVALPSIQESLGSSFTGLEWTVNVYTLVFAVLLVTAGRLGDIFGRVRLFVLGVVIFAVASGLIALAQSDTWLIAWRAVQGVGAAAMMPATLSIITHAFPAHERGRAIGLWAGVSAVALAIGPVLGGVLVEHVSWQSIFLLNLPVAVVAIVMTLASTKESRDETGGRSVDVPGVVTLTAGLGAIVLGLVQGNHWGWGSPAIVALLAGGVVALIAFFVVEHRSKAPTVDFAFFRSRTFLGANVVVFLVTFGMFALFFFLTLYLQNIKGYSPIETGVRFLPATVLIAALAPISGHLADRIGPRLPMVAGTSIIAVSLVMLSFLDAGTSSAYLAGSFVVMGIGMGLVSPPMSTAAMNAVAPTKAGVASGILTMNRMVGGTFGVAVLGAVVAALGKDRLTTLLPGASSAEIGHLTESLGSSTAHAGTAPEVAAAAQDAFVHALHGGMRVAAVSAVFATIVAWLTIAPASATAHARIEAAGTRDGVPVLD